MRCILISLVLLSILSIAASIPLLGSVTKKFRKKEKKSREIVPRLLPHSDNDFVLEFISDNSDPCEQMEAVVERLEADLDIKVRLVG